MDRRPAKPQGIARGAEGARAPVNIVAFSDFQCGYCREALPTIKRVLAEYSGKVRYFFRHKPVSDMHAHALGAAEASMAAHAQGKFWQMHDKLFEHQSALGRADLDRYAQEIGLDVERFKRDMDGRRHLPVVQADIVDADALEVPFTPVFFVNGRPIGGAQEFSEFKRLIDEELAAAKKLRAAGVPARQVAERLMADAELPAVPEQDVASAEIYKVSVGEAATRGGKRPKVTIVEVCHFECPFCKAMQPTLAKVLATYRDDVRLVWKHLPLFTHRQSALAAKAAEAAKKEDKFWQMHDKLFANQDALDRATIEKYAQQLKLDMIRFKAWLDAYVPDNIIDVDARAAQRMHVDVTPALFVNGRLVRGAQRFETLKALIDVELAKAEAKIAAGVPREGLYEEIIKDGLLEPPAPPTAAESSLRRAASAAPAVR
jgi:protein-disulfide isomerase